MLHLTCWRPTHHTHQLTHITTATQVQYVFPLLHHSWLSHLHVCRDLCRSSLCKELECSGLATVWSLSVGEGSLQLTSSKAVKCGVSVILLTVRMKSKKWICFPSMTCVTDSCLHTVQDVSFTEIEIGYGPLDDHVTWILQVTSASAERDDSRRTPALTCPPCVPRSRTNDDHGYKAPPPSLPPSLLLKPAPPSVYKITKPLPPLHYERKEGRNVNFSSRGEQWFAGRLP